MKCHLRSSKPFLRYLLVSPWPVRRITLHKLVNDTSAVQLILDRSSLRQRSAAHIPPAEALTTGPPCSRLHNMHHLHRGSVVGSTFLVRSQAPLVSSTLLPYFFHVERFSPSKSTTIAVLNYCHSYACANFISTVCTLGKDYVPTPGKTIGIYAAITFVQGLSCFNYKGLSSQLTHSLCSGLLNTFGVRMLGYLNNFSVWWHASQFTASISSGFIGLYRRTTSSSLILVGTTSIVIAVLIKAPTYRSAKFVFATFIDGTGVDGGLGWSQRASPAYVAVVGLLLAQYTLTGYDASAHVSDYELFIQVISTSLTLLLTGNIADVRRDSQCC